MDAPNEQKKNYQGAVIASWLLISLTCLVALIPGIGFLTWLIGGPILLITFILGIIVLSKGGTMQGVIILLTSLIAAPIFLLVAPILTTSIAAHSQGGRNESFELKEPKSHLNEEDQKALPNPDGRKAEE